MKKIILTIILCGAIVLGITGCGGKSDTFSAEEEKQIISEIESFIKSDRKSLDSNGYKNSYEVTITNIEKDSLSITFSGKLYIKYADDTENNVTFTGTSLLKPNPYTIYNTEVNYNF